MQMKPVTVIAVNICLSFLKGFQLGAVEKTAPSIRFSYPSAPFSPISHLPSPSFLTAILFKRPTSL